MGFKLIELLLRLLIVFYVEVGIGTQYFFHVFVGYFPHFAECTSLGCMVSVRLPKESLYSEILA